MSSRKIKGSDLINGSFRDLGMEVFPHDVLAAEYPETGLEWGTAGERAMFCELGIGSFLTLRAVLHSFKSINIYSPVGFFFLHPGANTSNLIESRARLDRRNRARR